MNFEQTIIEENIDMWYDSLNDCIAHCDEYYTLEPYTNRFGEYYYAYLEAINDEDSE